MRFAGLLIAAGCSGAAFLVLNQLFAATEYHALFLRIEIELVKSIAFFGCMAAAFTFDRGEHMRRAWLFVGGCVFFILLRDLLTLVVAGDWREAPLVYVNGVLIIVANTSQVIGVFILARTWRVSGFAIPVRRSVQAAVVLGVVLVAGTFGGPPVVDGARELLSGNPYALVQLGSALGDLVSFVLLAPMLLTALALRGGTLGWPWALITASMLAWLGYDGFLVIAAAVDATPFTIRSGSELFRNLGNVFMGLAGLAQRWVVVRMRVP